MELTRHTDDHVVEVGVEVFSLGDFQSVGRFEMVTGHDVVDVVDTSGSHSNFGEVHGPHTSVGVLGLVLREVGRVDVVVNVPALAIRLPISFVPLLVVVLLVVVVGRVNGEVLGHPGR